MHDDDIQGSADEVLADLLGPSPRKLLSQQLERVDNIGGIALVVQLTDGGLQVFSGGVTTLETLALFAFGQQHAWHCFGSDEEPDDDDDGATA